MSFPDTRPLKILVVRAGGIGDTVCAIPALRNLRRAYPNARIDALVNPNSGAPLKFCPYIDTLLFWRRRARRDLEPGVLTGMLATARTLRKRGYDKVYNLRQSISSAILVRFARIPERVGFTTELGGLFLHRSVRNDPQKHEVECVLDILRIDGIPILDTHGEGWTDPEVDKMVAERMPENGRLRVILCGKASTPTRDWFPERFGKVADWLIAKHNAEIHVFDHPDNAAHYESIRACLSPENADHWIDWIGKTDLPGGLSIFRRMDFVLGVDSGPLHLAAMFHRPILSLSRPNAGHKFHPWDTQFEIVVAPPTESEKLLSTIEVAPVKSALSKILANLSPADPKNGDEAQE